MDSITAMIFSPKARPIRLLLLDVISVLPVASTFVVASWPMTFVSEVRHKRHQGAAGGSGADRVIQFECWNLSSYIAFSKLS
jgi:hypothetical protein